MTVPFRGVSGSAPHGASSMLKNTSLFLTTQALQWPCWTLCFSGRKDAFMNIAP